MKRFNFCFAFPSIVFLILRFHFGKRSFSFCEGFGKIFDFLFEARVDSCIRIWEERVNNIEVSIPQDQRLIIQRSPHIFLIFFANRKIIIFRQLRFHCLDLRDLENGDFVFTIFSLLEIIWGRWNILHLHYIHIFLHLAFPFLSTISIRILLEFRFCITRALSLAAGRRNRLFDHDRGGVQAIGESHCETFFISFILDLRQIVYKLIQRCLELKDFVA